MARSVLPRRRAWHRAHLCLLAGVSAMLLGACASGPGGAGGGGGAGSGVGSKPPGSAASTRANGPATGPATTLRCGRQEITVRANAEQAEITVGAKRYLLQAQRSASGARYASSAYPGTSYWSKGDGGMLMIDGKAYPECATPAATTTPVVAPAEGGPPRDLTVREWVVESIDGRAVAANSRTTLTFDPTGQIAGRAGCNRYTGAYSLQGAQLSVSGVTTTRMICVPALMDQEARFLGLLDQVRSYQLQRDGSLLLRTEDQRRIVAR